MKLCPRRYGSRGITLTEILISLAITSLTAGVMVSSYVLSARSADWIAHSAAADLCAQTRLEQTRVAKWDTQTSPTVDELVSNNFPAEVVALSLPLPGPNPVYATNLTTITVVSDNPPLKMVRVDCVWPYQNRGLFTNSSVTYRGADQ